MDPSRQVCDEPGLDTRQTDGAETAVSDRANLRHDDRRLIRRAFALQIQPGAAEEYRRRHDAIWPELVETLKAHGVRTYSIFRSETSTTLFAYIEIEDPALWDAVGRTEVGRRWRKHMSDVLVTQGDSSPVVTDLHEVFHLE